MRQHSSRISGEHEPTVGDAQPTVRDRAQARTKSPGIPIFPVRRSASGCRGGFQQHVLFAAGLAALLIGVGLLRPALANEWRGPVKSLLEMRQNHVIVQNYDLSCGAAALATILDFQYGEHVTEKQVAEGLVSRKIYIEHPELIRIRQGFSLFDMKRYVDRLGFVGIGYGHLELKDILHLAPIIVPVSPVGYNHFVIFRGMMGDEVLLADPAFGNRAMSLRKFERIWIRFPKLGRVGFIVTRDGKPGKPGLLAPRRDQFVAPSNNLVRQTLPF